MATLAIVHGVFCATGVKCGDGFQALVIDGARVQWSPPSTGQRLLLRYAIADRDIVTPDAINCDTLQAPEPLLAKSSIEVQAFEQAAAAAFGRWQTVAGITFVQTSDTEHAEIVIGMQKEPKGYAFTNLTLSADRGTHARSINRAMICLNPEKRWKIGFDGNLAVYDLVHTLTHEIGHAIGLDHPSASGHLMSFRYDETFDGLTEGDIRGAVALFGAPAPTTTYARFSALKNGRTILQVAPRTAALSRTPN